MSWIMYDVLFHPCLRLAPDLVLVDAITPARRVKPRSAVYQARVSSTASRTREHTAATGE